LGSEVQDFALNTASQPITFNDTGTFNYFEADVNSDDPSFVMNGTITTGPNSFSEDEPNDALIIKDIQTGGLDTAIIELFNPVYDRATNSLTYTITAENATSIKLPTEFGQSVLVIDDAFQADPFY